MVTCLVAACSQQQTGDGGESAWQTVQDSTDRVAIVNGIFSGPEAVRYDDDQDIYFVANFNGDAAGDANGFISRMTPEGTIDSLRFMTGTDEHPLHGPRGMFITGDTLWAADADGVHGFSKESGEQIAFIDFTDFVPGFLNDIVQGPDGSLYVTDTGNSVVYKIEDGEPSMVVNSLPAPPNGIAVNSEGQIVLAPWDGVKTFHQLADTPSGVTEYATAESGGNFDGIEFINGRLLAASQVDSSLHVLYGGEDHVLIHVPGRPADIGLDTKRNRVAVPYIALNRVDIWQLPSNGNTSSE